MSEKMPPLDEMTLAVREVYAALNRNDIPAMVAAFDPEIVWTDPVESPMEGTYRGLAAVTAHIEEARAMWAEGSCEPVRFVAGAANGAETRIVALVDVRVRLKHETEWREGELGDVYTFRAGKVIAARSFLDREKALAWAGGEAPGAE